MVNFILLWGEWGGRGVEGEEQSARKEAAEGWWVVAGFTEVHSSSCAEVDTELAQRDTAHKSETIAPFCYTPTHTQTQTNSYEQTGIPSTHKKVIKYSCVFIFHAHTQVSLNAWQDID